MNPENTNPPQTPPVYNTVSPGFQQQAPYNPSQYTHPYGQPEYKKKKIWPWVLFLVLVAILGAGAYAYAFYVIPSKAIPNALMSVSQENKNRSTLNIKVQSANEQVDGSEVLVVTDIEKTATSYNLSTRLDIASDAMGALSVAVKRIDDMLYMKIAKAPAILSPFIGPYTGKWFSIQLNAVKGLYSTYTAQTDIPGEEMGGDFDVQEIYNDLLEKGIVDEPRFVGFGIDVGQYVRKYEATLNMQKIAELADENVGNLKVGGIGSTYVNKVESSLGDIDISPITISVDLISGKLRSVSFSVQAPTSFGAVGNTEDSFEVVKDTLEFRFTNTSEFFEAIEVPEEVTSLDQMISGFMPATTGTPASNPQ